MNNPHQFNRVQQLEHRLKMIQDDLNIFESDIDANKFVYKLASQGSAIHIMALNLVSKKS